MSKLGKKRSRESYEPYNRPEKRVVKIKSEVQSRENVEVCEDLLEASELALGANKDSFLLGLSLKPSLTKVKVYLPKLKLPESLPRKDWKAMIDLSKHLREHGFEVCDRPTLAFFAIGMQLDVQAALECFLEFYKLAATLHFRFPDISQIEQLVANGLVEGIACHSDGTTGLFIRPANHQWEIPAIYIVREMLCHILRMVEFSVLKNGATKIANMRDVCWRNFAPYEIAKIVKMITKCNPIFQKRIIFADSSWYISVGYNVILKMLPTTFTDVLQILSLSELCEKYPDLLLPPSLSPSTSENVGFCHLSVEEQMAIQVLVDH